MELLSESDKKVADFFEEMETQLSNSKDKAEFMVSLSKCVGAFFHIHIDPVDQPKAADKFASDVLVASDFLATVTRERHIHIIFFGEDDIEQ